MGGSLLTDIDQAQFAHREEYSEFKKRLIHLNGEIQTTLQKGNCTEQDVTFYKSKAYALMQSMKPHVPKPEPVRQRAKHNYNSTMTHSRPPAAPPAAVN